MSTQHHSVNGDSKRIELAHRDDAHQGADPLSENLPFLANKASNGEIFRLDTLFIFYISIHFFRIVRASSTIRSEALLIVVVGDHKGTRVDLAQGFKTNGNNDQKSSTANGKVGRIDA